MDILQVCAYGAENPGNFIASLQCLEEKMREKGFRTIYAFPEKARNKHWCEEIQKKTDVYFLPEAKARIHPKTYRIFRSIYRNNNIAFTHSHFELYDIPATITAPKYTKIFWHLHDPINVHGKRALLWRLQYGIIGKRAHLLAVSRQYKDIAVSLGFPEDQAQIVLNGISLDRITLCGNVRKKKNMIFLRSDGIFIEKETTSFLRLVKNCGMMAIDLNCCLMEMKTLGQH